MVEKIEGLPRGSESWPGTLRAEFAGMERKSVRWL